MPIWRNQIDEPALTDTIIQLLAQQPLAADRQHYLAGLSSTQSSVIQAAAQALSQLPQIGSPTEQLTVLSALQSLFGMPNEANARASLAKLYCSWNKLAPPAAETKTTKPAQHYAALLQHFQKSQPELAKNLSTQGTDWLVGNHDLHQSANSPVIQLAAKHCLLNGNVRAVTAARVILVLT